MQTFALLIGVVLPFVFFPAFSEEPELTRILVQGATRPTDLEDLPSSASVIKSTSIEARGIQHFQDLFENVPGLSAAGGTSRTRFFQIRGIGEFEQYEGAPNPSVGFFMDGVDLSGLGSVAGLFDVDQVEVLRGPQATRFGSSALAGAIALNSKDPGYVTSGRAEITRGTDDLTSGGFAVGGPIDGTSGKLRARFSAFHLYQDGFRNNRFLKRDDTNQRDESLVRGKVSWDPTTDFSADLASFYSLANNKYDAFAIDNSFNTQSDRPGKDYQGTAAHILKVRYIITPDIQIKNTASSSNTSVDYSFDGDWGNNPFWSPYDPYDYFQRTLRSRNVVSDEFRLETTPGDRNKTAWLIGGFAQQLKESSDTGQNSNNEQFDFNGSDYKANTRAVFSQIDTPVTSDFTFTVAGRYEQRAMHYSDTRNAQFSPTNNMLGGSTSLTYHVSEQQNIYVTAARGFKGGGFNAGPNVPANLRQFQPEYLWNFEVGTKGSFFDRTVDNSTSLFYMARRDQQAKFAFQNDPSDPLSFTYVTDNAARGFNVGLENDTTWRPSSSLHVKSSLALLGTRFTDYSSAAGQDLSGRGQSYASPWQHSQTVRYYFHEKLFLEGNLTGRGAYYFDDSNNQRSKPYHLLNGVIGYERESWSIRFWARNILGQRYATRGFYFGNEPPDYPNKLYIQRGDPTLIGTTVSLYF